MVRTELIKAQDLLFNIMGVDSEDATFNLEKHELSKSEEYKKIIDHGNEMAMIELAKRAGAASLKKDQEANGGIPRYTGKLVP
jgi:hypothetical protein